MPSLGATPSDGKPCIVTAGKGYHSREQLKALAGGAWNTRIAGPEPLSGAICAGMAGGLRGRENLHKRHVIHVAEFNLGVLMRPVRRGGHRRKRKLSTWPLRRRAVMGRGRD
jgi:hypothetical protein